MGNDLGVGILLRPQLCTADVIDMTMSQHDVQKGAVHDLFEKFHLGTCLVGEPRIHEYITSGHLHQIRVRNTRGAPDSLSNLFAAHFNLGEIPGSLLDLTQTTKLLGPRRKPGSKGRPPPPRPPKSSET